MRERWIPCVYVSKKLCSGLLCSSLYPWSLWFGMAKRWPLYSLLMSDFATNTPCVTAPCLVTTSSLIRDIRTHLKCFIFQVRGGITHKRNAGMVCNYSWAVKIGVSPSTGFGQWQWQVFGSQGCQRAATGSHGLDTNLPMSMFVFRVSWAIHPLWDAVIHPKKLSTVHETQSGFNMGLQKVRTKKQRLQSA